MPRTVYSNTSRQGLMKALMIIGIVIGIGLIVLFFFIRSKDTCLFMVGWWVIFYALMFYDYKFRKVVVDDEQGIIYDNQNRKYPMQIALITYVSFKESKKGKYRSLFIHDSGVKFMDIRTPKANADAIVEQLVKANPGIEIRHTHFI